MMFVCIGSRIGRTLFVIGHSFLMTLMNNEQVYLSVLKMSGAWIIKKNPIYDSNSFVEASFYENRICIRNINATDTLYVT